MTIHMKLYLAVLILCLCGFAALLIGPAQAAPAGRILVPARDIGRGEIVQASDFTYVPVASGMVAQDVLTTSGGVVGHQSRRTLPAGKPLRADDFRLPQLVSKGMIVTMTYDMPGISLTASMRAIGSGGLGETITVQNPVSFRQVAAVVTGTGTVRAQANDNVIGATQISSAARR